jgi:uncharacterized membrane protein
MIEIIPNWHPVFVHFPISFATAAVFFFAAAQIFKGKPWAAQSLITGRWMLWAAAIFACIAAVFGWFAYNSVEHDDAGHLAMTLHRNWALVAVAVLVLLAVLDAGLQKLTATTPYGFLALLVMAWLLVVNAAWHGGEVVFRHGLGVMSLPESENHGHEHAHEHAHGEGHDEDHGVVPVSGVAAPHDHGHDSTANDEHQYDTEFADKSTNANSAVTPPQKAGHTHAPGTPSHQD